MEIENKWREKEQSRECRLLYNSCKEKREKLQKK
jgi:hypothetical protein